MPINDSGEDGDTQPSMVSQCSSTQMMMQENPLSNRHENPTGHMSIDDFGHDASSRFFSQLLEEPSAENILVALKSAYLKGMRDSLTQVLDVLKKGELQTDVLAKNIETILRHSFFSIPLH